jgi:hypothetical protein
MSTLECFVSHFAYVVTGFDETRVGRWPRSVSMAHEHHALRARKRAGASDGQRCATRTTERRASDTQHWKS